MARRSTDEEQRWPAAKVELWAIDRLKAYARNARAHSAAQVSQIVASMREWGFTVPILVDETGTVIAGHARLRAAEQLKLARVPVMVARGWSEAQRRAYLIADNQLALNASWDEEMLAIELKDLQSEAFDMELLAFKDSDLARLTAPDLREGLTDPDAIPPTPPQARTQPGDVWVLGTHRVICGDCTQAAVLDEVLQRRKVDAVWTDPPYGVDYSGKGGQGKMSNDSLNAQALKDLMQGAFTNIFAHLVPGGSIYVAHAEQQGLIVRTAFAEAGFKLASCIIWRKQHFTLSRSDYQWQHEPILYGWHPGAAHRWFGGRREVTIAELPGDAFALDGEGAVTVRVGNDMLRMQGGELKVTAMESSLLCVPKPSRNEDHPTVKPVELVARMLRNSTQPGDTVLDCFGGSGSTLIACEALERSARLVELEPRFCDVIVDRWQQFTGKTAELERAAPTTAEVAA